MSENLKVQGELLGRNLSIASIMFHDAVAHKLGMSATEWRCLELIDRMGPITAKRLSEESGLTTGAITGVVDRLEKAGYARRERNPDDRRSVVIQPLRTREIDEKVAPIFESLLRSMDSLLGKYSERELNAIQDFFKRITQLLKEETAKLRKNVESPK
jgi:DNA-binding MarR family transcriptional regulator